VFVGRRAGLPDGAPAAWQMPQGGIDADEDPAAAVLRELREEIGTDRATILAEHPDWLTYELPPSIAEAAFRGRYRGQRQKWFALRFEGEDVDIVLDGDAHPEFVAWRWVALAELPLLAVPFKRAIYETVSESFGRFADRK
jgi:putative (di)nucleoside polyphosphate hydrolase